MNNMVVLNITPSMYRCISIRVTQLQTNQRLFKHSIILSLLKIDSSAPWIFLRVRSRMHQQWHATRSWSPSSTTYTCLVIGVIDHVLQMSYLKVQLPCLCMCLQGWRTSPILHHIHRANLVQHQWHKKLCHTPIHLQEWPPYQISHI